ncbi:MAG: HD domain-containing phosphohydrolase [Desulfobacteraceae bacterium]
MNNGTMPNENSHTAHSFSLLFITDQESEQSSRETFMRLNRDEHLEAEKISGPFELDDGPSPSSFDAVIVSFGDKVSEDAEKIKSRINCLQADGERMVLALLPAAADAEIKSAVLESGFDDCIVNPVSPVEVKNKLAFFYRAKEAAAEAARYRNKLDRTFGYLDRYRDKLAAVKKELHDERRELNNSLKQISLMTGERKRLKSKIKSCSQRIKDGVGEFARILSKLIETRVERNRGHALRVAEIACFVGREMELGAKELAALEKACLLHETGMLLLPGKLLDKDGTDLSGYEQDLLHHYPVKGAVLLESFPGLEKASNTVRFLNENMDGSGRPEGLRGRNIPVGSRILAGADMFDELRFQESEEGMDGWFAKLEEYSGSRLDPLVVHHLQKYAATRLASDGRDRMKGVGIHQLEPGMTIGVSLFTAGGTKLFSADTLLDTEAIEKIIRYNREYPVNETIYIKA